MTLQVVVTANGAIMLDGPIAEILALQARLRAAAAAGDSAKIDVRILAGMSSQPGRQAGTVVETLNLRILSQMSPLSRPTGFFASLPPVLPRPTAGGAA